MFTNDQLGTYFVDYRLPLGTEQIINMVALQREYAKFLAELEVEFGEEPIKVCPYCKTNEFFDSEWGLWCPVCQRELKEKELELL